MSDAQRPDDEPTTETAAGTAAGTTTGTAAETAAETEVETAAETEVVPAAAEPVPLTADPAEVPPVEAGPSAAPPAQTGPVEPVAATPEQPHRVVYVEAPNPPRIRGNRVAGVLLALVGAVVFAALYALVGAFLEYFQDRPLFGDTFTGFVSSAAYWVPILVFALAFILLVVIVNRGGWAAHVFGSLLLAFVVYFASIGLLLLVGNLTGSATTFSRIALYPQIIASAVIAREVAIWLGLGIAARGRRVKARNVEDRARYDRDVAEQRAQYDRPAEQVE